MMNTSSSNVLLKTPASYRMRHPVRFRRILGSKQMLKQVQHDETCSLGAWMARVCNACIHHQHVRTRFKRTRTFVLK